MLGKAGPVSLSVGDGDRRLQARTDLRRKINRPYGHYREEQAETVL